MKKTFLKKSLILLSIIFILTSVSSAQEILVPLHNNAVIKNYRKNCLQNGENKTVKRLLEGSLELPFFDDFSNNSPLPENLWADENVFINTDYIINSPDYFPPTIGVATFDAIDSKGELYNSANNIPTVGDYLTSQPINLGHENIENVYLSFFCQAGGLGDLPEENDSLVLEFYSPAADVWTVAWDKNATGINPFEAQIVYVHDTLYQNNFQFRFKNYFSTSGANPSLIGNCDHWHIDYVYLNANRNETDLVFNDIAFQTDIDFLFNNFTSIPWKHLKQNPTAFLTNNKVNTFTNLVNLSAITLPFDSLRLSVKDISGNAPNDTIFAGNDVINPLSKYAQPFSINFPINSNSTDSALFEFKAEVIANDPLQQNNLAIRTLPFYNYYAYDDGTAENGYGVMGEINARIALQYETPVSDTITAIQIHFNQSKDQANQKYFYLAIWSDNGNGQPDTIIFEQWDMLPDFGNQANHFKTYRLDNELVTDTNKYSTPVIVSGKYYIGIVTTTEDFLNIGFDKNNNTGTKIHYFANSTWSQSQMEGSLMMRPVFGALPNVFVSIQNLQKKEFAVFPNPASDYFNIELSAKPTLNSTFIEIYNLFGALVHKEMINNRNEKINVKGLNSGVYLIKIRDNKNNYKSRKIFIEK